MKIFPNPVIDKFKISGIQAGANVSIINASGQQVKSVILKASTMDIDVSSLPSGIYFVKIIQDSKANKTLKFLKK